MTSNQLLTVTSEVGRLLIEYGAEIYRVEDSINRITAAYSCENAEVFAIPPCLIITIDDENGIPITRQMRITKRSANLDRVNKLNNLSRFICSEKPDYEKIMTYIGQIKNRSTYKLPIQIVSYAVVGASFAVFFGGGWRESVMAAAISIIIKFVSMFALKVRSSVFLENVICSFIAAGIAVMIAKTGLTEGFDTVIIGTLMNLVPGIALTNCMRDFIAGDFIAGLYTMIEALLIACGMAVGAAAAIALFSAIL